MVPPVLAAAGAYRAGALSGAAAILLGAFGAHSLPAFSRHPDPVRAAANWSTAAQYHLAHSVVLLVTAGHRSPLPARLFTAGIGLFSGSLYLLAATGEKRLGAITPIGGLLLTAGWLSLLL